MDNEWKLLVLKLKKNYEKKGMTQVQIAELSGMHQSHVSRFFGLKYAPKLDTFFKISKAINVDLFLTNRK